jgi:hypothetical protein
MGITDLDLGMTHLSVWKGQAQHFGGAERCAELNRAGAIVNNQVRRSSVITGWKVIDVGFHGDQFRPTRELVHAPSRVSVTCKRKRAGLAG